MTKNQKRKWYYSLEKQTEKTINKELDARQAAKSMASREAKRIAIISAK